MNQDSITPTDEELLLAARNGDHEAFGELIKRHERRVATTVKGMLGDTPEAEDIGQETFLRLFRSLKSFRGESKIETYLTRIAINLSINELRRRRRHSLLSLEHDAIQGQPQTSMEPGYDRTESQEAVQKAISSLKPKLRSVVVLRMIDGYSTAETSKILRIPQGTVLSRLARAQMKLKEILSSFGLGERNEG